MFAGLLVAATVAAVLFFVAPRVPGAVLVAVTAALLAAPGVVALSCKAPRAIGVAGVLAGLALVPLVSIPAWLVTHPVLHVDNAHDVPIALFVDGVRVLVVPPSRGDEEPPRLRLPFGAHRLAWAPEPATVGLHEIEVAMVPTHDHLYAPGAPACYWVQVTAYGNASTHGTDHGPRPLAEFHRLASVDVWFGDTPRRVQAPAAFGGARRVAVQRLQACTDLAAVGCDARARAQLVECLLTIDGRAAPVDCYDEAVRACRPKDTGQHPPSTPQNVAKP